MEVKVSSHTYELNSARGSEEFLAGHVRDVITMTVVGEYAAIAADFVDGTAFTIVAPVQIQDEEGRVTVITQEHEYAGHTVAGPITDNRDGTVVVKMGKTNTKEQDLEDAAETAKAAVVSIVGRELAGAAEATMMRSAIESAMALMSDEDAAETPSLSKAWVVGETVQPGDRRYYAPTGKLYKVRDGQGHTTQESWTPDKTPALWAVVDITHAGTAEDPIPAARGMEYEYGKIYLDPEDGKRYLCKRTGEAEGGKITLHYLPHELIGQYFEEVTA